MRYYKVLCGDKSILVKADNIVEAGEKVRQMMFEEGYFEWYVNEGITEVALTDIVKVIE